MRDILIGKCKCDLICSVRNPDQFCGLLLELVTSHKETIPDSIIVFAALL